MGLKDLFKGGPSESRGTEVRDDYLDSLRREKTRIDNEDEKKRLKKEIAEEYKNRNRKETWGIKNNSERETSVKEDIDKGRKFEEEPKRKKQRYSKSYLPYDVKTSRVIGRKGRKALKKAHEGIARERLKRIQKKKQFESKARRFEGRLASKLRSIKISEPKTEKITYRVQPMPQKNQASLLNAPNNFAATGQTLLRDNNGILKAESNIIKTRNKVL